MKTAKERIEEKITLLECVKDILSETEWRIRSAENDIESCKTRREEYLVDNPDCEHCYWNDEIKRYSDKVSSYIEIQKMLEKMC